MKPLFCFICHQGTIAKCYKRVTAMMNKFNCSDYLVVCGGFPHNAIIGKLLQLSCGEYYENLTEKVHSMISFIFNNRNYDSYTHIYKIDEDCTLLKLPPEHSHDYAGPRIINLDEVDRKWHFGKCHDKRYEVPYKGESIPWRIPGCCYSLSRKSMEQVTKVSIDKNEIFEDLFVAKILRKAGIFPQKLQSDFIFALDFVKPLDFVHIPINSGTAIENWGNNFGLKWGRFNPKFKGGTSYWHIPTSWLNSDVYTTTKFCVVRNPYDRICSAYKYKSIGQNKSPSKIGLNIFVSKIPQILGELDEDSKKMSGSALWEKYGINNFILPQYLYVFGVDEILRFEDLDSEFDRLCQKYNFPTGNQIDLGNWEAKNNPIEPTILEIDSKDLNAVSIETINSIYSKDFEQLRYERK